MSGIDYEDPEEIKVILIGDSGVGKTNLINTSIGLEFEEGKRPTISGSFMEKLIEIDNKKYSLNLWDTAGQEAYRGVTKLFFKGSEIVILVYDITSHESFVSLEEWSQKSKEIIENDFIYGIVGNKNDLYLNSQVNEEELKKFAESINSSFKIVSAKTDPQAFNDYLIELAKQYKQINKNDDKNKVKLNDNIDNNNKRSCFGCGGNKNK